MLKALAVESIPNFIEDLVKLAEYNAVTQAGQYIRIYYGERALMKHLIPIMSYPWGVDQDTPNASPLVVHQNKKGGYYFRAYCLKTWLANQALPEDEQETFLKTYTLGKVDKIQPNTNKGVVTLRWKLETSQYKEFGSK